MAEYLKRKNFLLAARKVLEWNRQEKHELERIVEGIIWHKDPLRNGLLLRLIAKNPDLQKVAIAKAMKIKKFSLAESLLKEFNGPLSNFHQSKEYSQQLNKANQKAQSTILKGRKRLGVLFKKGNWMQIEAKLLNFSGFLKEYVQTLFSEKETEDIALSIIRRNDHLLKLFQIKSLKKSAHIFQDPQQNISTTLKIPFLLLMAFFQQKKL